MQLTNGPLRHWVSGIYTYLINKYTYNNIKVKIMKKKNYLLLATAALALVACTADDTIGDSSTTLSENQAIGFNFSMPASTRAAEANAADAGKLNYEFIVWGEKNESDAATTATNIVFENYRVQYKNNDGSTKNSTVSNTTGWDYVGIAPYTTNVTPNIGSSKTQTIKYWDFGKTYTFTAVSALTGDITGDKVTITKNKDNNTKKGHGYTIKLTNGADISNIFVAERQEKSFANGAAVQPIQMVFRQFQTKVRFGFYETVPGYDVKITGVKYGTNTTSPDETNFGVDGEFIKKPASTSDVITYTITYDDSNKPVLSTTKSGTTTESYKSFGTNAFNKVLGKTSDDATFDQDQKAYTAILPHTENATPMTFKVSYKLISEDTGEEIVVTDRQVTVPAVYCKWKPNFAYTYLFKVSDKSTELYPITFDAVVAADELNKQETITEVAGETDEVCITTIGFNGNTVVESTTAAEYGTNNIIYASVTEGDDVKDLTVAQGSENIALYNVVASGTVAPKVTEASVANCIKNGKPSSQDAKDKVVEDVNGGKLTATPETINTDGTTIPCIVTSVPREDGNGTRDIPALKFQPTAAGTYAIEYTTAGGNKYYKIVVVK